MNQIPDHEPAPAQPSARHDPKPISAHLGFLFSLLCPGWGEYYSGRKLQGVLTLCVLLALFSWFSVALFLSVSSALDAVVSHLADPTAPQERPGIPLGQLAISTIGLILVWLWSVFQGTKLGLETRDRVGGDTQASTLWGAAMSVLCPGAGHAYARAEPAVSWTFLIAYALALTTMILSLGRIMHPLSDLMGQLPTRPQELDALLLVNQIRALGLSWDYDISVILLEVIRYLALTHGTLLILDTRQLLGMGTPWNYPRKDDRWLWSFGAAAMGFFCPGGGQVLQNRRTFGMLLLALFLLGKLAIALLVFQDRITLSQLSNLDLLPTFIRWAALLEALVWGIFSTAPSES